MCWPLEGAILFYSLMNGQLGDLQSESDIAKEVALKVQSLSLYEQVRKDILVVHWCMHTDILLQDYDLVFFFYRS